ncbi:family 10 glycosylhydrolase [Streptomyces alkaliphilus]|uniref:family 10 glycosylhydrolase n=1 Tax=Streptomyces alkaliphilus TaxID=1472722 RepID=UPI00117C9D90|nr:family 10 glycosylhydrolase [Streptomyces alkaliphilus]MQS07768.1 family 10 glycosylhydrolase [Streptomyces alkaliphilus]
MRRIVLVPLSVLGLLTVPLFASPAGAAGAPGASALPTPLAADSEHHPVGVPDQWRSYWVDAFNEGIQSPARVSRVIEDALAVNANALIVQISRRWDCFCDRSLYPRTDAAIDPAPYDPLDEVIRQAREAGLEVHAWVNVNTLWNSATPPRSPEHAFNRHGPTAEGADRWLNRRADGTEMIGANSYIDPGHPAAVDHIVEAVRGLVREYDVDGINLDYIRHPDGSAATGRSDWGYNEVSLARFRAATGRVDTPHPADAEWTSWRRDQVTGLVRRLYLGLWEEDPTVRLSVNAVTYGHGPGVTGGWESSRPYTEVLQDWAGWLEEGIVDTVVAMNYKRQWMPDQAAMFAEWSEFLADHQSGRQAVNGPALYLNPIAESVEQARIALAPTAAGNTIAGWSGYSYANPSSAHVDGSPADRAAERDALARALTTGPRAPLAGRVGVPGMEWRERPTDGHLAGTVSLRDGTPVDGARVTARPLLQGSGGSDAVPVARTDGSGRFGLAHLPVGRYLVTLEPPAGTSGPRTAVVRVTAGGVAAADFTRLTPRH